MKLRESMYAIVRPLSLKASVAPLDDNYIYEHLDWVLWFWAKPPCLSFLMVRFPMRLFIVNPRRSRAARVTVVVVCVCLSVCELSHFTSNQLLHKRYHVFSVG